VLKPPVKQSVYADYLYRKVDQWLTEKGRGFTVQEIAQYAGLTVTHNLRTRLTHAVAAGTLDVHFGYLETGKPRLYFTAPAPAGEQQELPF